MVEHCRRLILIWDEDFAIFHGVDRHQCINYYETVNWKRARLKVGPRILFRVTSNEMKKFKNYVIMTLSFGAQRGAAPK